MKTLTRQLLLPCVLATLALLLAACDEKSEIREEHQAKLFGRIDYSDPASPVIIWQGSRIEFVIKGAAYMDLFFSRKSGQVYFNLWMDDKLELFIPENGANRIELPKSYSQIKVALIKRNEAASGTIAFDGLDIPRSARFEQPQPTESNLNFLFFGDSITAGACNEDGAEDQWDDMSTHNALRSYAAITAAALQAEYQNISISGMGISMGYTKSKFPETWNKLYPYGGSDVVLNDEFKPDYVFINLGENDDSWSKSRGVQFPLDYDERYIAMVREMRKTYPDARFVLLRGGMYGGAKSERLREPWLKVVKTLEEEDSNLTHFVFRHWSKLHPRVKDHEKMAAELISWLRTQPGIE